VIQWHIIAMFLPSLITGKLIQRLGHSMIMYFGITFFAICIFLSYFFDQTFFNYAIALVFLGFGWNFLFVSGTSLLVISYRSEEKYKAQAYNDFTVFSAQGMAALSAGLFLNMTSWQTINLMCLPFLAIIALTIWRADRVET
jgi:MFS family permease